MERLSPPRWGPETEGSRKRSETMSRGVEAAVGAEEPRSRPAEDPAEGGGGALISNCTLWVLN